MFVQQAKSEPSIMLRVDVNQPPGPQPQAVHQAVSLVTVISGRHWVPEECLR